MKIKFLLWMTFGLLLALSLSACGGDSLPMAFSPQQAAIQMANNAMGGPQHQSFVIPESIFVHQTQELNGHTFVLLSFNRNAEGGRLEECTMMYEVRKTFVGWTPGSGGGGCAGRIGGSQEPDPKPAMEVGGGSNSGGGFNSNEPGFSDVNGVVNNNEIIKVRITWDDNQVQEVEVINGSYLALRVGKFHWTKVEGLGADANVLFSNGPIIGPKKQ